MSVYNFQGKVIREPLTVESQVGESLQEPSECLSDCPESVNSPQV